jgi:hypothetical protein
LKTRGVIEKVFAKDWDGRDGKVTLYSFQLTGDNKFYRTGTEDKARKGDYIEFEFDPKGNVDLDSVKVVEDEAPPAAPAAAAKPSFAGRSSYSKPKTSENWEARAEYWDDKEKRDAAKDERYQTVVEPRITWSSAQSDAVRLVGLALQHDLLSFGNANKAAKLGLLLGYVDQVTARFAASRWNGHANLAEAVSIDTSAENDSPNNNEDLG